MDQWMMRTSAATSSPARCAPRQPRSHIEGGTDCRCGVVKKHLPLWLASFNLQVFAREPRELPLCLWLLLPWGFWRLTWSATRRSTSDGLWVSDTVIDNHSWPAAGGGGILLTGAVDVLVMQMYGFFFSHSDGKCFWLNQNHRNMARETHLSSPPASQCFSLGPHPIPTDHCFPCFSCLWGAGSTEVGGILSTSGEPLTCQASLSIVPGYAGLRWMSIFGSELNNLSWYKLGPGRSSGLSTQVAPWAEARLEIGLELQELVWGEWDSSKERSL